MATELVSLNQEIKSYVCQKNINQYSETWKSEGDWTKRVTDDATNSLVKKTARFGHWIVLDRGEKSEVISLVSPTEIMRVEFDSKCQEKMSLLPIKKTVSTNEFSDAELLHTLATNRQGIIALWSPNMNHSYNAITRWQKISKELKLPVTFVMDPKASTKTALAGLKKRKINLNEPIRKLASLDIIYRNGLVHFPNFYLYKNGEIVTNVIPGVMGETHYKKVIQAYLKGDKK